MRTLIKLLGGFLLKRATSYYSLSQSMYKGPGIKELGTLAESQESRVQHIFSDRTILRKSSRRVIYEINNATLNPKTGLTFWNQHLISESSSWPPERILLNPELWAPKRPREKLSGAWISLPSTPYYHWLMEDLPAALAAHRVSPHSGFLVSKDSQSFVFDFLKIGGYKHHLAGSRYLKVETLILCDKQNIIGTPQIRDIETLRRCGEILPENSTQKGKRIYISRLNSSRSPKFEIELVVELRNLGFEILHLEKIPWDEQVAIFKASSQIVGIHGAGLSNAVFCKPGSTIIEIMDTRYPNNCFELLASNSELRYHRILTDEGHSGESQLQIILDEINTLFEGS